MRLSVGVVLCWSLVAAPACSATFGIVVGDDGEEAAPAPDGTEPQGPEAEPDRTPPVLELDSPAAGAFVDAATVPSLELRGRVHDGGGEVHVTVGGAEVPVAADGTFAQTRREPVPGVHTFFVEATDAAGNVSAVQRSVLYGTFEDGPVTPAVVARLGGAALDATAGAIGDALGGVDFEGLVRDQNPIAEGIWGTTTVEGLTRGPIQVSVEPAAGRLDVTVRMRDVDVDLHNDAPGPWNQDGWARADALVVVGHARPSIRDGGGVRIAIDDTDVSLEGFDFDISGIEGEGLVRDRLQGIVEDQLDGLVRDRVPGLVEDALAGLDPKWSGEVLGTAATVALAFDAIAVDDAGVQLTAGVSVDVADSGLAPASPGSLRTDGPPPALDGDGVSVAIADDLANAVLDAAWRAGLLHRTARLPSPAGGDGLTVGTLALLVPALGDLAPADAAVEATLDPRLPPVVALRDGGELSAALGELHVSLVAVAGDERVPLLELVARLDARVAPAFTDAGHVSVALVDWSVHAEPVAPPPGVPIGEAFGDLLDGVVDLVAPSLDGALAEVPIPSIAGLHVREPSAETGGPDGDWMTLRASLDR